MKNVYNLCAHRGASEYWPENTLSSFYAGIDMGADGVETDIQRTKDGVLVIFHDPTMERTTGQPGKIQDYTYDELTKFFVHNEKYGRKDKIITFEEFLRFIGNGRFKPFCRHFAKQNKRNKADNAHNSNNYKEKIAARVVVFVINN